MAAQLESRSPATGAVLGAVVRTPPGQVARVVAAARAVQPLWAQLRLEDRARYLRRAAQALVDDGDALVELVCREQGRPRVEARFMELLPAVETLRWLAEAGPRILGPDRVGLSWTFQAPKRARVVRRPLGVVAVITPAAEPLAVPVGDVGVALMAGNAVVLKPSPLTPLVGERVAAAFARAGLPEGLLRVLHGDEEVGRALVQADVDQVRLTGSPEAGREVGELCAREIRPATLALAGKDPMLVLADAPLERAVDGALWGAFANAGQCGGSIERAYVVRPRLERFLDGVVAGAGALRVGDPLDARTAIGPLTSARRAEQVHEVVEDAVRRGATLHCGGPRHGGAYAPAVLSGVPLAARVLREEVPGPVLVVAAVADVDEAIERANEGPYGLGASVWTRDRRHGERIARLLACSMVWINDHLVSATAPQLPWGGTGASGIGRARGAAALRECAGEKVVTWDPPLTRPLAWHPYDAVADGAGRALTLLRSARDRDRSRAWREGAVPLARHLARAVRGARS